MDFPKPFRLLHLPSLARDVIFSLMKLKDVYHLSKSSTRSRNVVKMFTLRQTYFLNIKARKSGYDLQIRSAPWFDVVEHELRPISNGELVSFLMPVTYWEDYWAAAKEEILFLLDVFTREVNYLSFDEATQVIETTEFLKTATHPQIRSVCYCSDKPIIDDEVYKYVLKEFKNAKELEIEACPSAEFRFDDMEPFTGDEISIRHANWVTVDHVIRCFSRLEKVELKFNTELCLITPASMNQLLNAWQKEWRIKDLELACDWSDIEFQSMFENIPTTEVKRVQINRTQKVFKKGQCYLLRQEESGVELLSYMSYDRIDGIPAFYFKTNFQLLRDDEPDSDFDDSDDGSNHDEQEDPDSDDDSDNGFIEAEPWNADSDEDLLRYFFDFDKDRDDSDDDFIDFG